MLKLFRTCHRSNAFFKYLKLVVEQMALVL